LNGNEYPERFSPDGLAEQAGGWVSAPVVTHPGWCDPRRCSEADGDVEHCSELVSLRTQDARLTFGWVATDAVDTDQQPELRIDIRYAGSAADAQLFLVPQEAYQLAEQLLSCYWRQYYQHAPVVRNVQAVVS
jgi:hypothetical protein